LKKKKTKKEQKVPMIEMTEAIKKAEDGATQMVTELKKLNDDYVRRNPDEFDDWGKPDISAAAKLFGELKQLVYECDIAPLDEETALKLLKGVKSLSKKYPTPHPDYEELHEDLVGSMINLISDRYAIVPDGYKGGG